MPLKFTHRQMMRFLDLYEKHDILWNPKNAFYTNVVERERDLEVLRDEMGMPHITVDDVKRKITVIRSVYKKEYLLVARSKENSNATDSLYTPQLPWYKRADKFLNAVCRIRHMPSTVHFDSFEEVNCDMIKPEYPALATSSYTDEFANYLAEYRHTESASDIKPLPPATADKYVSPRKRKPSYDNVNELSNKRYGKVHYDPLLNDDEFDIFGKHVAVQLRQLPMYDAIICRDEILSVIRKKRFELLSLQCPHHIGVLSPPCSDDLIEEC